MRRMITAGLAGAVFAAGLALSGMTQPQKVIDFLDVTGDWDPSLAFVMGGAILFFAPLFHWVRKRERMAFGQALSLPTATHIDARLIAGSALFGVGWGLAGYCPGPALTAAGSARYDALMFAIAMVVGMAVAPALARMLTPSANATTGPLKDPQSSP